MRVEDFIVGNKYKKIDGKGHIGEIAVMSLDGDCITMTYEDGSNIPCNFSGQNWEPIEEFKCGDLICVYADEPYTYVGTTADGRIITMEGQGTKLCNGAIYIWANMKWKLYEEPKRVELTMEEIADKLGIEVSSLKIVGEK